MSRDRSKQKLLEFLDYLGNKVLMAGATVATRKAAANKVLGILSEEEAADVTALDLDEVMSRFQNLEGKNYTAGSLNTYLSRLRSAIDDFNSYLSNPLGFKSSTPAREKRSKPEIKKDPTTPEAGASTIGERAPPRSSPPSLSSSILPIPIRPDITVYVQGLPYDLNDTEAREPLI
jgi:hypothetical protein